MDAWESLFRAQVAIMRRLASGFPSELISLNEYDVLFNLSLQPERSLRMRDLNKTALISQPSISRLVDRLTSRGILSKRDDPEDGRGTIVTLTDDGYELFRRVAVLHIRSITATIGDALDEDELVELGNLCERLRAGLPDEH
ncbi:MarR family winged helix-turn-helix transcriptional regulator [Agromyces seonyuensis]|uniref:MarR family winged helix-turn-helix transcriptional regulator n=1 Tax=Agromyces seonyuensis TaxID=2662446 RepID=UPI00301434F6